MRAKFEIFKESGLGSIETLCRNAASFATKIGPDDLISLTHGIDRGGHSIVVWYWDKKTTTPKSKRRSVRDDL